MTTAAFPPQWNFSNLELDAFLASNMTTVGTANYPAAVTGNVESSLDGFSMTGQYGSHIQAHAVHSPAPPLPVLPPAPSDTGVLPSDSGEAGGPTLGRSKRKPIPSLRAQRDNLIGDVGKENSLPVRKGKKPTEKCSSALEVNDGPPKKR